jgi:hypothetical protein
MDNFSYEDELGLVMTFAELEARLGLISQREHQWTARLAGEIAGEWQLSCQHCVEIWYRNPEFIDMPNQICYRFPAFQDVMGGEPFTLVCLHPSLAIPVVKGLYFERDELKYDLIEDWCRFWLPLRKHLSAANRSAR